MNVSIQELDLVSFSITNAKVGLVWGLISGILISLFLIPESIILIPLIIGFYVLATAFSWVLIGLLFIIVFNILGKFGLMDLKGKKKESK